jgi:hypothetical protein
MTTNSTNRGQAGKTGSRRKIIRIAITAALFLALSLGGYGYVFSNQIRCQWVAYSDLERIQDRIYVERSTSIAQRIELAGIVQAATLRLEELMGPMRSKPILIAGHAQPVMNRFGQPGNQTAVTHLPMGQAYIVLGPDGINVDVVAHEMLHGELCHRIGWVNREWRLPVWFDEGLAMQLDRREAYSEENWQLKTESGKLAPKLDTIVSGGRFFNENYWMNYATSKHEVARWFNVVGKRGLNRLIDGLAQGGVLQILYDTIEAESSSVPSNEP